MSFYSRYILPRCLETACGLKPIRHQRSKVVPHAEGVVLEIGIGSGLNLPHYQADKVTRIIGVDPDEHIWRRGAHLRAACQINVERIGLSGEDIPLEDNSVDSVVCTYTLCTIPDPVKALVEMRRILKPGGLILFSEHGKAPDASIAKWQRRLDPLWRKIAGGCHTGRDIPALFAAATLKFERFNEMYIPGPKVLGYHYWGSAR